MPQVRRILCPVDFSETSDAALRYADALAQRLGADLALVHVYQMPFYPFQDGMGYGEELTRQVVADLDGAIASRRERVVSDVVVRLVEGVPHRAIVAEADALGADLLVLGTHGRSGVERLLIGSVAERVVRTAKVPVITIPRDPG